MVIWVRLQRCLLPRLAAQTENGQPEATQLQHMTYRPGKGRQRAHQLQDVHALVGQVGGDPALEDEETPADDHVRPAQDGQPAPCGLWPGSRLATCLLKGLRWAVGSPLSFGGPRG